MYAKALIIEILKKQKFKLSNNVKLDLHLFNIRTKKLYILKVSPAAYCRAKKGTICKNFKYFNSNGVVNCNF